MSLLPTTTYANPSTPFWETAVAGQSAGTFGSTTTQTIPVSIGGLTSVTIPRRAGYYVINSTINVTPSSATATTFTSNIREVSSGDTSQTTSINTTNASSGNFISASWVYLVPASSSTPLEFSTRGGGTTGGASGVATMVVSFTPA